jgi:hypothetical protein
VTVQTKIEAAKKAKQTMSRLLDFGNGAVIFEYMDPLFASIAARSDWTDQQKEVVIDMTTMGIFITALSVHKGVTQTQGYSRGDYPRLVKTARLVQTVGIKAMKGERPFPSKDFIVIIDKYTARYLEARLNFIERFIWRAHPNNMPTDAQCVEIKEEVTENVMDDVATLKQFMIDLETKIDLSALVDLETNISSPAVVDLDAIEARFQEAIEAVDLNNPTPLLMKFVDGLIALKRTTSANFSTKKTNFDPDECMTLANSALALARKVQSGSLTQADVYEFTKVTQPYRTCNVLAAALAAIIGAVVGMIAGAAVGFVVGGVPGAILGGVSGLVAGGGLAGLSFTMWHMNNQPLNKISAAATDIVQQNRT